MSAGPESSGGVRSGPARPRIIGDLERELAEARGAYEWARAAEIEAQIARYSRPAPDPRRERAGRGRR